MEQIVIELGHGVKITAPIKQKMTLDEWIRMTTFLNAQLHPNLLSTRGNSISSKIIEPKRGNK